MAKKKRKSKSLLPKRIAGVKVPKAVRRGRFGALLASPAGQLVIAEAIMAAGALAGAKKAGDTPKARDFLHDAAEHIRERGRGKVEMGPAGGAIGYALGEAVRSFADALRSGDPQSDTSRHDPEGRDSGGREAAADGDWSPSPSAFEGEDAQKKRQAHYPAGPL